MPGGSEPSAATATASTLRLRLRRRRRRHHRGQTLPHADGRGDHLPPRTRGRTASSNAGAAASARSAPTTCCSTTSGTRGPWSTSTSTTSTTTGRTKDDNSAHPTTTRPSSSPWTSPYGADNDSAECSTSTAEQPEPIFKTPGHRPGPWFPDPRGVPHLCRIYAQAHPDRAGCRLAQMQRYRIIRRREFRIRII
jgi:hypothetical protein